MSVELSEPIQFGKYTLFERIGRGGMADVYKGRVSGPQGFERTFVVKRILPHLSEDPTFIKMFVEEAKLSARLAHPNIVQIFEARRRRGRVLHLDGVHPGARSLGDDARDLEDDGAAAPGGSSRTSGARRVARSATRTASPTSAAGRSA